MALSMFKDEPNVKEYGVTTGLLQGHSGQVQHEDFQSERNPVMNA